MPTGASPRRFSAAGRIADVVDELYLASLSRPPVAAELESGVKYLQTRRRTRRARAGSAVGAGQQQSVFVQLLTGRKIVMLVIPGRQCHTCEGPTRRELLRAGSIGMLGLNLANFLAWQKTAKAATKFEGARGFGAPSP